MLCPGGVPPENILCKLHNGVFSRPQTRINTECFLPTREGVSPSSQSMILLRQFPPYTGGCIEKAMFKNELDAVSSLHGRVYRHPHYLIPYLARFLPTREGVSAGTSQGCAISRRGENPTKNLFMIRAARPGFFVLGYGIRLRYLFFISMSSICSDIAATVFKTETGFLPAKNIATCAMYSSLVMAETKVRAYCVLD